MSWTDEHGTQRETLDAVFVEEPDDAGSSVPAFINPMQIPFTSVAGRLALSSLYGLLKAASKLKMPPLGLRSQFNSNVRLTLASIHARSIEKVCTCTFGPS
jgi:hypothetical protein